MLSKPLQHVRHGLGRDQHQGPEAIWQAGGPEDVSGVLLGQDEFAVGDTVR